MEKRKTGSLISQQLQAKEIKTAPVSQNLKFILKKLKIEFRFKKDCLTTVTDNRIHFGDTIMLRCEGTNNKPSPLIAKAYRNDCYISTGPLTRDVTSVAATGASVPALNEKTGLILQSVDGSPAGSSIKFGQPFAISTFDKSVTYNLKRI